MDAYTDKRVVDFKVTFGLIDTTAASDATPTATSQADVSQIVQITDSDTSMSAKLSTLEDGYFLLDGNSTLIPSDITDIHTGWWSSNLSDSEGIINEMLTFAFSNTHDSIGFTIDFDDKGGEYPTEFTVKTYSGETLLETKSITNDNVHCVVDMPTENYDKAEINFTKTSNPYRRIRVATVTFGIIQYFNKANIKEAVLLREVHYDSISTSDFDLTFDNTDRAYNMVNPTGLYNYLQQAQALNVEIGVGQTKDSLEWEYLGTYYYVGSESSDGNMTATINAQDLIKLLENTKYSGYVDSTDTIENVLSTVLATTGLNITTVVPEDVQGIVIYKRLPKDNVRNLIYMIANAGMCAAYIDRQNRLVFTKLTEGMATDILTADRMAEYPIIAGPEYKNGATITINDLLYDYGGDYKIEANNCLVHPDNAITYLAWLVNVSQVFKYTVENRGNPKRDIADTIKIYDYFGENGNAVITKSKLVYDGGLSEEIEAIGRRVK